MPIQHFNAENTEGYGHAALDAMNAELEKRIAERGLTDTDPDYHEILQQLKESVLSDQG